MKPGLKIAIVALPAVPLALLWSIGALLATHCGGACLAMERWARTALLEPGIPSSLN